MANEPDIIQKLSADFNVVNDLPVEFTNTSQQIDAQFGTVYVVGGDCRVLYATTATWNSQPQLIADRGYLYIYADYKQNEQGQNIAGIKVGDGNAYLIDMPFTDDLYARHIEDTVLHISQEDRDRWDNKVTCFLDPLDANILIFSKS